jgi:CHAT domain-containing protein
MVAGSRDAAGDELQFARTREADCATRLALSLWDWSASSAGKAGAGRPEALEAEAFEDVQRATQSAAGDAMARTAALAAARAAGVGDQAAAYEAALVERTRLDLDYATAANRAGPGAAEARAMLGKARLEVIGRIEALAADLRIKVPRYWDYRSPEPLSVASLQNRAGPDAVLLHDNEALLVFLTPSSRARGLVFAVTNSSASWAQIPLTGDELRAKIQTIRTAIKKADEEGARGFPRQTAFELYRALLGDPSIQSTIKDKTTLLFVPTGPLTSLPPGLLVTAPPEGGVAADSDPTALRSTPWLLRSKAVALLPAVSSLRTLRQLMPTDRAAATEPLLAFADPDFAGSDAYRQRDSSVMGEELRAGLHRLPGTRIEGEALRVALGGRADSVLTGSQASKAELMARNADGRLARVKVIEFATHGLVAGQRDWLPEPALVLAAGNEPEDELLLASEASTLRLNADWVLLSACNTASADAPEAQGLSGLTRAFFHAGASSLLVSHWPIQDLVASRLLPAMLTAERDTPALSHAEALRRASLAILDDPKLDAANPYAWAPFTLVGETRRGGDVAEAQQPRAR